MGTIKRFHLDIDAADLPEGMRVGTGASRDPEGASQLFREPVGLGLGAAVENLDDIDPGRNAFDRLLPQMATGGVVRVFEINESTLLFDRGDCLFGRKPRWNLLLQKEAYQFAFGRENLLANDGGLTGLNERVAAINTVVIREEDRGEAQLATAAGHLQGWHPAVKGGRTVQVQVHPNPGAPCTSGHVRYYSPGEGSGKGLHQ